jgi:hypothetical protein
MIFGVFNCQFFLIQKFPDFLYLVPVDSHFFKNLAYSQIWLHFLMDDHTLDTLQN